MAAVLGVGSKDCREQQRVDGLRHRLEERGANAPHWDQCIGLRTILQGSPIFHGKIDGFRLRFSLKPIR